jgi:hypothetical protein
MKGTGNSQAALHRSIASFLDSDCRQVFQLSRNILDTSRWIGVEKVSNGKMKSS